MRRRKNPYRGILRPTLVGSGAPEVSSLLIYDIENDNIRNRVADACLDYGLLRIQYSAFFGKLNRNRREELMLRLRRLVGENAAKIRLIPICQADLDHTWVFEQLGSEEKPAKAPGREVRPTLRIVASKE